MTIVFVISWHLACILRYLAMLSGPAIDVKRCVFFREFAVYCWCIELMRFVIMNLFM